MREAIAWLFGVAVGWWARRTWGLYRVKRYFESRKRELERREREGETPDVWTKSKPPPRE
jgi:hypothetical protein